MATDIGSRCKECFGNYPLYIQIHEDAMLLIESIGFRVSPATAGKILDAAGPAAEGKITYTEPLGKLYLSRDVIDEGLDRVRSGMAFWPKGFGTGGMAAYIVDKGGPRTPGLKDMERLSEIYGRTDFLTSLQTSFNLCNRIKKSDFQGRADLECGLIDIMIRCSSGKLVTPTLLTEKAIRHLAGWGAKGHKVGVALSITSTFLSISDQMVDPFLSAVRQGIPFIMNSMPIGGLTAPYSMSSLATLAHAEAVFGLVLAQLIHPGIRCVHAAMPTISDLSKKDMPLMFGSRSNSLLNILLAELNAFLGIPGCQSACSHSRDVYDEDAARETVETFSLVDRYDYHSLRHLFGFSAQLNDFSIDHLEKQIDLYLDLKENPIPVEIPSPAEYDPEGMDAILSGLERGDFRNLSHTLKNIGRSFTL
ncbi:trimethylamine methyltransferase family protein [Desulfospira joergensenii]|uniref:trimethylamine methyltransferase family protein n=1 Tax=Desulfospira joergensenii TaxID=53329 RepID=UPI001377045D|nr:trimethylamine methyltransferase family protein [Desulfospira joergensenii]